jgi:hypothetical protein
MKRSRSPDTEVSANTVVDRFSVQPSSLPIVLFGNVKPGRVREYLVPLLPPMLADIVSAYTAYAFTSFGHPGFLLFIVDGQLVCRQNGEARIVPTPFVPRYVATQLDSDVGVWDMSVAFDILRFERHENWNGHPNDGVSRMVTTGITQVPRDTVSSLAVWDDMPMPALVFVNQRGTDMLYNYRYDLKDVLVHHGTVSIRHDDTLTVVRPTSARVRATKLTLSVELRGSRLDVCVGMYNVITVLARGQGCDPVLYRTLRQGIALERVYEDDVTVELARLVYPDGWGYTFRRTKMGCLWVETDTVCSLRDVQSIHSGGHYLLIDHATLGYQIISFTFDESDLRSQLRTIATRAARVPLTANSHHTTITKS